MTLKPRTVAKLRMAKKAKAWPKAQRDSYAKYLRSTRKPKD